MKDSLQKVAVISGAFGYVGSAVARQFIAEGMIVALLYNRSADEKVQDRMKEFSGQCRAYHCDLADAAAVESIILAIEKDLGAIEVVVHAAGVLPKPKQLHLSSVEDVREQVEENLMTGFIFLSQCARKLKEHKRGVIIGITTAAVVSEVNTRARGTYSVVKFALQGALAALREELAVHGVRVYAIAPGVLPGGMNSATPQAFLEILKGKSATKTLATAEDVATTASFLASDAARSVTTFTILVAPETVSG